MNANYDRTLRFAINGVALMFIILAVIQAFRPYVGPPDPRQEEIIHTERQMVDVLPAEVPSLLHAKGKPVMLVVYASWCPYCAQLMPEIVDLMRTHQLDGVTPLFLSLDSEPRNLSKYLVHHDYHTLLLPYRLTHIGGLARALAPTGSHYMGAIPYVGFFDYSGKLLMEPDAPPTGKGLLEAVHQLK